MYAYDLLIKQAVPYNEKDPKHERMLKDLWEKLHPDVPAPDDLKDPKWKEIGFQVCWQLWESNFYISQMTQEKISEAVDS